MWGHDTRLTGYQSLAGEMKSEPRVLAKYFVGTAQGAATFADLRGTHSSNDVLVVSRSRLTAYDPQGNRLWESNPEGYVIDHVERGDDLDGDGRNEVVAAAGDWGMTRR